MAINTKTIRAATYSRVSTLTQDATLQSAELARYVARRGWELAGEFSDVGISGARDRRPALDQLLAAARRRRVDVIVVWALDRLGRSLRHLVTTVEELGSIGVDIISITQPIDTTTPAGKLTFAVLSACAEFERDMCRSRVQLGLAKARALGKQIGRPKARVDSSEAIALRDAGLSIRDIAERLGTSKSVIGRLLTPATASP